MHVQRNVWCGVLYAGAVQVWGVAWDRRKNAQGIAYCAAVERLAQTLHNILRPQAHF